MPLSPDSLKVLESVKKTGNPCRFVLVKKEGDVAAIAAYRKGSAQTHTTNAKQEAGGGGETWTGVIDGQGVNLRFALLSTEYKAAPVKDSKLKDFLKGCDKAFKDNKASFAVVDALPNVADEDDQPPPRPTQKAPYKYRTSDEWKTAIAAIQNAKDKPTQVDLHSQAVQVCTTESEQAKRELQADPTSTTRQAQSASLAKVSEILKRLTPQLPQAPPLPGQPPNRPLPPLPGQLPPVPLTPPEKRRQEQLNSAQPGQKMLKQTGETAVSCKENPFAGADLDKLAQDAKTAAEKTRVGVHKDKTLPAIHLALADAKNLAAGGKFNEAEAKLKEAQELWKAGKAAEEKERKGAILGATKQIHDERLAEYAKVEPVLNAALLKVGAAHIEMTHAGDVACKAVRNMLEAHQKGTPEALNPHFVNNLESYLKLPGVPDTFKALGEKLAKGARDALQAEFKKRESGAKSPGEKAELLLELAPPIGSGGGSSGTSEVQLVWGFDKQVAYAFKPLDGESVQNDGDTLREALSSGMSQKFRELTNLDLGFPEVNVAKVGRRQGALIEGLNGFEIPAEKASRGMSKEKQDELDQLAQKLPPKEVQKAMLSAMVTGDFDMKWDNIFVGPTGDTARRFDGGKGFPDAKGRGDIFVSEIQLKAKIPNPEACLLLYSPCTFQPLPVASAPIDPDLRRDFLKIKDNLDSLKQAMKQKVQESCQSLSTTDKPQQMDGSVIDTTCRSIEAALKILEANDQITTEQFYKAFTSQRVLDMADDHLGDLQSAIAAYDENAVKQHLQGLKLKGLDADLNGLVAKIRLIIQGGSANYDDAKHGKELHKHFRSIDRLLALQEYVGADPQAANVNDWKKVAKVTGKDPFDQTACESAAWSALGMLTPQELVKLTELCAFNSDGGIDGNAVSIQRPIVYPATIAFTTSAPDRPAKIGPQIDRLGISLPHKKGDPMNLPSANSLVNLIRGGL